MIFKENKMKGILLTLLVVFSSTAYAQGGPDIDTGLPLGNGRWLSSRNASGFGENKILRSTSSDNTEVNAPSGKSIKGSIASTPITSTDSTGHSLVSSASNYFKVAYVATPATNLTPVAGTNDFRPITMVATAAPTSAAIALPASPVDGEEREFFNAGANPVVVAALGTPVMNGGAGRRTVVATNTRLICRYYSARASWRCVAPAAEATPIA